MLSEGPRQVSAAALVRAVIIGGIGGLAAAVALGRMGGETIVVNALASLESSVMVSASIGERSLARTAGGSRWLSRKLAPREALPARLESQTRRRAPEKMRLDCRASQITGTRAVSTNLTAVLPSGRGNAGTVVSNSLSRRNPGRRAAYRRRGELSPNY